MANGEIVNLTLDGSRLELTAPRPYQGPLAGILKQDDGQVCAVRNCSYVGRPVFRRVYRHLFGETAGAGEPEALSSPWGLAMAYKIENCAYKTR